MLKIVVCIKQVPVVSELPWDPKTGTLRRDQAQGMINPACRCALEAGLELKRGPGAELTVISMGPPEAEDSLRTALALGADQALLLSDPGMAGADTLATSYALARAIERLRPDFDLALCGCHTSDSETAQVGPQLAVELDIPCAAYVDEFSIRGRALVMRRLADDFLETLEMELPGLVTVTPRRIAAGYPPLGGLERAFSERQVRVLDLAAIGADPALSGALGSATRIVDVYQPGAEKQGLVLKGAPKRLVGQLLERYADRLGGVMGKDLTGAE